MASPQKENGYTPIANEIIDQMVHYPQLFRGSLFPMICVIWRKTYGWQKKEDAISVSQFMEATGYSRRSVIYALQELEAKNLIKIRRGNQYGVSDVNVISFNKDYETWVVQNSAPQVESNRGSAKLRRGVVQNSAQKLKSFAPTKEKRNTKEISEQSSGNELLDNQKKDMGWNKYSEEFEEGVVDIESGELHDPVEEKKTEDKERSKKFRASVDWLIKHQGRDSKRTPIPKQLKAIQKLYTMGVSAAEAKQIIIECEGSDLWRGKQEKPDFWTVVSLIQKRG